MEPLATRCVDEEHGGFLVDFDERWIAVGPHEKSLEHAARTTSVFALLHRVLPGAGHDRLALHGSDFLREVMWDDEYGGFFARVDRQGRPLWDGLKHPHAVAYATEALHLCRDLLPGDAGAVWVDRALDWLDQVAWDPVHGGYWGCYRRDNRPYAEGDLLPTPGGRDPLGLPPGLKEINTQSDALQTLAVLAAYGHDARCARRRDWLTAVVRDRLIGSDGALPYAYHRDWRRAPGRIDVGYQFQTSRRLAPLARASGEDRDLLATSCRLVDFCLESARHPAGGFSYSLAGRRGPIGGYRPTGDARQWWVQAEAVHALHALAQHELLEPQLRAGYRAARDRQWSFVRGQCFDERYGGMCEQPSGGPTRWSSRLRAHVPRPGARRPALKSHAWKDASHETWMLVALGFEGALPELSKLPGRRAVG